MPRGSRLLRGEGALGGRAGRVHAGDDDIGRLALHDEVHLVTGVIGSVHRLVLPPHLDLRPALANSARSRRSSDSSARTATSGSAPSRELRA